MKIRTKTNLIVFSTFLALLLIIYITFETILMHGFNRVEIEETKRNVLRVTEAISEIVSNLAVKVTDWAKWDDTYHFIEDKNSYYIASNLNEEVFSDLKINLILFFDKNRNLVYGREFTKEQLGATDISAQLLKCIQQATWLFEFNSETECRSGIACISSIPLFISSRPITTSEGKGPIRGTLIFAQHMEQHEIDKLSSITHLSVQISLIDSSSNEIKTALKAISESNPFYVKPLNRHQIAGYTLLKDVMGKPMMIARIDTPRQIYHQGKITKMYMITAILFSGLVIGIILNKSLEKNLISRLTRLNSDVKSISDSGDPNLRVGVSGLDELSFLASSINKMIEALQMSESRSRIKTEQLRLIMNSLPTGLLTLDEHLNINPEYSPSAEKITGQTSLAGKPFTSIIFPDEKQIIEREKLFDFLDVLRQDLFPEKELALLNPFPVINLQSEQPRWVKISYHKINRDPTSKNHILVDIEDITAEKQLEQKIQQSEQENIQLKILAEDPDLFKFFLFDMNQIIDKAQKNLAKFMVNDNQELLHEVFRDIHTIKGTASSFGLGNIAEMAGNLENCFHSLKESKKNCTEKIIYTTQYLLQLSTALQEVKERTRKILGDEFSQSEDILLKIPLTTLNQLYCSIEQILKTDQKQLALIAQQFQQFRAVPVKRGMAKAFKIVPSLQKRFATDISFTLDGGDLLIDCALASQLNTPMIHLLRNAFVHGIETVEERFVNGKNDQAQIKVHFEKTDSHLTFTVSDDGRGIDPENIRNIAVKSGYISQKEADKLDNKQIIQIILTPGFTTTEIVNEISGRGMGMNAVYNTVVNELNGSLDIQSEVNIGTSFSVKIPLMADSICMKKTI